MKSSIRKLALVSLSLVQLLSVSGSCCMNSHSSAASTGIFLSRVSSHFGTGLSGVMGKVGSWLPRRFSDLYDWRTMLGVAVTVGAGWYAVNWLRHKLERRKPTIPIIYDPGYNITAWGLEKLHPFDTKKYGNIFNHIMRTCGIHPAQTYRPRDGFDRRDMVTDADLQRVHNSAYLHGLGTSLNVARVAEVPPIAMIPNFIVQRMLLNPIRKATQGTITAAQLAIEKGWAINLSGGYHHAKREGGSGFCFFADIPLAIYKLWDNNPNLKVLIVDLDAHHGDGHASFFQEESQQVAIFDMYNTHNFPANKYPVRYNYPLGDKDMIDQFNRPTRPRATEEYYLNVLRTCLPQVIEEFQPDFIFYNAGSDPHELDRLGGLLLTDNGIRERDEFVFRQAVGRRIPICMVLSGGYGPESARVVGASIQNILQNVLVIDTETGTSSTLAAA